MTAQRATRIWECPECGRSVNRFVNGCRCPSCRTDVSDECECPNDGIESIAR